MRYSQVLQALTKYTGEEYKQSQLCQILNISRGTMSARYKNDSEFLLEELIELERVLALPSGSLAGVQIQTNENCIDLDYFSDVWASCGTGAVVFEETSDKISVPTSLIQNYSKSNKYSVINARGDSMQPFLQDRDKLIVEHWNGGQIIDNCIYVFRYANELFVKRLVKNITQIVIKSDNPLYEPIKITDKDQDFEIIGQIVGLMRDLR
jgi:phage repressor protein C with HTH and peptisase S24 domain